MTIEEIKTMVNGPDYDFLRTNPHLGGAKLSSSLLVGVIHTEQM